MKLGFVVGYSGAQVALPMPLILEADQIGYDVVWTAEAYGSDAVTTLAWIGALTDKIKLGTAIMQMPARTPAMTAMTAMTLNQLSNDRMVLGLGLSGPQVVEGWHGVVYGKPLRKTREYVHILKEIFARKAALEFEGEYYQIPYNGDDATGLGKPLKSILHSAEIPIYLAAIGPKNVELAGEIADGWLPIFFAPEKFTTSFLEPLEKGLKKSNRDLGEFDISPSVSVVLGDDLESCYNQLRPLLALYIGGMGAKGKNFYFELACRYGFEDDAERIQNHYLAGEKAEAVMAVPTKLIDEVALVGSKDRIKDHFGKWKNKGIGTLNIMTYDIEVLRFMREIVE